MDGQWRPLSHGPPRSFQGFQIQGSHFRGFQASYPAYPALSRRPAITLECFGPAKGLRERPGAKRRAPLECSWAKSQGEQTDRLRIGRLGLTHRARPLYSRPLRDVGLARPCGCPCGGIGRRARLKIEFRKECWFDSGQGHQVKNMNNNNNLQPWFDSGFLERFSRRVENTHTKVHCSRPFCSHFCWHQLALRFALLISAAFCFRIESKDQRRIRASDKGQAVD